MAEVQNNNLIEYGRWIKQAKHDLDAAKWSSKGKFYDTTCFQAQQAAEKALKAYLLLQRKRIIVHSVYHLLRECIHFNKKFANLTPLGQKLDKYYIPTRYPDGLPTGTPQDYFTLEDAEETIQAAKKIILFVETLQKSDEQIWDHIMNRPKNLTDKEAMEMKKHVKQLRSEKGFRM
ncbi:MAG: HEPN domain-containing protein [Nanoarchaeota archaeon]